MQTKKDDSFKDFIIDQMGDLGGVTSRPLFGGHGLYQGRAFFGIIFKGRLYFKTDPSTQPLYKERGMSPFRPSAGHTLKNYYEVPTDVIEEPEQLTDWAREAALSGQTRLKSRS